MVSIYLKSQIPPHLLEFFEPAELGLEPLHDCLGWATGAPCGECYVCRMVEVFRLVRDVCADDGVLWLNLGDSYAGSGRGMNADGSVGKAGKKQNTNAGSNLDFHDRPVEAGPIGRSWVAVPLGTKKKDLVGIPWRVALALQADGWYLRSHTTWCKPNGMPESVEDRPTVATEAVFLFSKSECYHYDAKAVRMPPAESSIARWNQYLEGQAGLARANGGAKSNGPMKAVGGPVSKFEQGSNHSNLAITRDKQRGHTRRHAGFNDRWNTMPREEQMAHGANLRNWWIIPTEGYDGAHFAVMPSALARICILAGSRTGDTVLDPFFGSGTVGQAAEKLGRQWIGIELNPEYAALAEARTQQIGMAL